MWPQNNSICLARQPETINCTFSSFVAKALSYFGSKEICWRGQDKREAKIKPIEPCHHKSKVTITNRTWYWLDWLRRLLPIRTTMSLREATYSSANAATFKAILLWVYFSKKVEQSSEPRIQTQDSCLAVIKLSPDDTNDQVFELFYKGFTSRKYFLQFK